MPDVNTRRLRYFVAVAEELHFSRAAARLHLAQQALSKQIRELEIEVGATLFRRSTRLVELTPAGEEFLQVCRDILARLDSGLADLRRAGRAQQRILRLGFTTGAALELTAPILTAFGARYPDVDLQLREYDLTDASIGLSDGSSDVAILRLPIALADIETVALFVEPMIVGLAAGHRLAGRSSLTPEDLLDEPIALGRTSDPAWRDFWSLASYRGGQPAKRIVETSTQTEELGLVSAGLACCVTVAAVARYMTHPSVVYLPLVGHPGSTLAIGWRRGVVDELARDFADVALQARDRAPEVLKLIEHPL